jgi:hypothetical protein
MNEGDDEDGISRIEDREEKLPSSILDPRNLNVHRRT